MSFFINNNNQLKPGAICGNATYGLCEKILIETTRVFDACMLQIIDRNQILTATSFDPATPTLPLTFISAENDPNNPSTISDVNIVRLETRPNFANVTGTVTTPVIINYRDANGVLGVATATITTPISTILCVPQPSVTPVTIKPVAVFSSTIGTFTAPDTFNVTGCLQIVIKVVSTVDILVPSYGYPCIQPCQASPVTQCPGVFDQPLYPR